MASDFKKIFRTYCNISDLAMSHRKQLAQQKGVPRVLRPPEDIALGGWPVPLLSNKLTRVGEVALAVENVRFEEQLKLE